MAASSNEQEQRIIDHEVRVAHTEALVEQTRAARRARVENRGLEAESQWFRQQYITMLRSAATSQELHDLGLTDELVRDARLGGSLTEAWERFRADGLDAYAGESGAGSRSNRMA